MIQKVLKVGSSAAVIIPKKSLEELGIRIGDKIRVEVNHREKTVVVEPVKKDEKEILDWTSQFIKKYRSALEALAKK